MNIIDFKRVLTALLQFNERIVADGGAIKDLIVPMAWGDPGLGKTDIATATAEDLGWHLVYADLATRDPAELDQVLRLGLPPALEQECLSGTIDAAAPADLAGFRRSCASLPNLDAIIVDPDTYRGSRHVGAESDGKEDLLFNIVGRFRRNKPG